MTKTSKSLNATPIKYQAVDESQKQTAYLEMLQESGLEIKDFWIIRVPLGQTNRFVIHLTNDFKILFTNFNEDLKSHLFVVLDENKRHLRWSEDLVCDIQDHKTRETSKAHIYHKSTCHEVKMLPLVLKCLLIVS